MATIRPRVAFSWRSFESWVGTRGSAVALFALALAVFAIQSLVIPAFPGRDMSRYIEAYQQLFWKTPIVPSVLNTRGPLADLGVGLPLEAGGWATEAWLALLYALSILAWGRVALHFGARAAIAASALLLLYPGYGILFHGLSSDALFAAAFAGWAVLLARAILAPSVRTFLLVGAGLGILVLVRPANQVLVVFAVLPLVLGAPWGRRFSWLAAFFIPAAVLSQAWKALATWRWGTALGLAPSATVLLASVVLLPLLFAPPWRRRLWLALGVAALPMLFAVVVKGVNVQSPSHYARALVQSPGGNVFLYRTFELDRIVSPENGPASREAAAVVRRELLSKEPYRSYGVGVHEFFSSGSDRIFGDFTSLSGQVDLSAVTEEAIRRHRRTFATSIASTIWQMLWARRVYAPESSGAPASGSGSGGGTSGYVVIDGRRLPRVSDGQPIPASRVGLGIQTLHGPAGEVWVSATSHPLVFTDPRDRRRYERFESSGARLNDRLPTRGANEALVHHANQTSHVFPPPVVWIVIGLVGLIARRPRRALVALAPALAGLVVIVATGLIAPAVGEYAAPVSPAFIVLAAAGALGARRSAPPAASGTVA